MNELEPTLTSNSNLIQTAKNGASVMTKLDKTRQFGKNSLSIEQENAIDLLITGKSDKDTGEVCGVSRQTVIAWKREPEFHAELNKRRAALWQEDIDRLRSLVGDSITILAEDLQADSKKVRREAAVHILRAVGIYGSKWQPAGSEDVYELSLKNWNFFS